MKAEIISVGTELLLGDILNTDTQYLARQLAALGFTVQHQCVVGDNDARLAETLTRAMQRTQLLVVSGGLGPTEDDLTRTTAARVFGDTLIEDSEELQKIQSFFDAMGKPMSQNNKKQAMVPLHGRKFVNRNGTAPGLLLQKGEVRCILLPGPPSELVPMFEQEVLPYLRTLQTEAIVSRWLYVVGISESTLDEMLADRLAAENPTVALYAKTGEVHIRVTARAENEQAADTLAATEQAQLCSLLGGAVYATDVPGLETALIHTLKAQNKQLAVAESCTGGLLAGRLTAVAGCSAVFECGVVSYSERVKQQLLGVQAETLAAHTVYSAPIAAQMARGVRALAGADMGIGITGIAGPGGALPGLPVGTVFIAVATADGCRVCHCCWEHRNRQDVRLRACNAALDLARRVLLGLDTPDAPLFDATEPPTPAKGI